MGRMGQPAGGVCAEPRGDGEPGMLVTGGVPRSRALDSEPQVWNQGQNLLWAAQPLLGLLGGREVAVEVSSSGDSLSTCNFYDRDSPVSGP